WLHYGDPGMAPWGRSVTPSIEEQTAVLSELCPEIKFRLEPYLVGEFPRFRVLINQRKHGAQESCEVAWRQMASAWAAKNGGSFSDWVCVT
ncbi:hypothetical protein, partial [Tahibacter sp.]|uniref:hypothetical protein n=1 Tax=Tahibacter sp. TaxID=2056211 RepID=UPI0028C4368C